MKRKPIVIAHRGASGYLPEHTLAGYFVAIEQGADYIEPDLVMTREGVLVARHENEISLTTDVAVMPEFAERKTTKEIDGVPVTGWFTEDFTLAELKMLRAKERIPRIRPANTRFDGMFPVPTLEEILGLLGAVNAGRARTGHRPVGIYPEIKHPTCFAALGLPMEERLVEAMYRHGYRERGSHAFIQCFEVAPLRRLARMTPLPLVQLMDEQGPAFNFEEIAGYAQAIGVNKSMLGAPGTLMEDAHAAGLAVHAWTFRAENAFLPRELRRPGGDDAYGDVLVELRRFLALGLDGLFIDQPDLGVRAVEEVRR